MIKRRFECNFTILNKQDSDARVLGVLCQSDDIFVYGVRKYSGEDRGIYVDVTYLTDIGNNWKDYSKFLKQDMIMAVQRDKTDPILKSDPSWDVLNLIPWQFAVEYEMSEQGEFIVSMIYDILKRMGYDHFSRLCQEE